MTGISWTASFSQFQFFDLPCAPLFCTRAIFARGAAQPSVAAGGLPTAVPKEAAVVATSVPAALVRSAVANHVAGLANNIVFQLQKGEGNMIAGNMCASIYVVHQGFR